jgi:hypothetical protein
MEMAERADATWPPRRIFVVAGMHRAGTSVVARGLQALGVDLGDRLMSADVRMNARGFFEDVDIVQQDDALLATLGADWKSVAVLADVHWDAPVYQPYREAARRLLEQRLARSGQFGFKDPRAPRLLPFWRRAFAAVGAQDAYVIAVRHPSSVIASLTARDALDIRRSAWLWLTHLVCSLRYTQGRPRVVVDYDQLLAAPQRELARMAHRLQIDPHLLQSPEVRAYTEDFLSDELRHARHAPEAAPAPVVAGIVAAAHGLAQRLACDAMEPDADATHHEVERLFAQLLDVAPLLAYTSDVERVADDAPRLAGQLAWSQASLAEATRYCENLQQEIARRDEAFANARAYIDDLQATIARKDDELRAAHDVLRRDP